MLSQPTVVRARNATVERLGLDKTSIQLVEMRFRGALVVLA